MHVDKVITDDGDILFIYVDEAESWTSEINKLIRHGALLVIIQEITDPAELPEYLTDEDLDVVEAAKLKLNELTGE